VDVICIRANEACSQGSQQNHIEALARFPKLPLHTVQKVIYERRSCRMCNLARCTFARGQIFSVQAASVSGSRGCFSAAEKQPPESGDVGDSEELHGGSAAGAKDETWRTRIRNHIEALAMIPLDYFVFSPSVLCYIRSDVPHHPAEVCEIQLLFVVIISISVLFPTD
jgi:hypothetical protein